MRASTLAKKASYITVVAALILALGLSVVYARAITRVDVANKPDRIVITVQADCVLKMTPLLSSRGNYVGFQFPCQMAAKGRLVRVHSGRIYSVKISSFRANPPLARIVVNTKGHCYYSTDWSPDRTRVEISVMKTASKPQPEVKVKPAVQEISGAGPSPIATSPPKAEETQPARPAPEALRLKVDPLAYKRFKVTATQPKPDETPSASAQPKPVETALLAALPPVAESPAVVARSEAAPSTPAEAASKPKVDPLAYKRFASAEPNLVARYSRATTEPAGWSSEKRVSLNFLGADINDVLKALAVQSGKNIVAGKDVTGNVTVSLSNVGLEEALDYVAKLSGYSYTEENGTYLVASRGNLSSLRGTDGANIEVVPLKYTNPDDVIALLKNQCPEVQAAKATVQAQNAPKGTQSAAKVRLVLSGPPETLAQAVGLVDRIEYSMKVQSSEEKTELYRIKYVNGTELKRTLLTMVPGITVTYAPTEGFDLDAPTEIKVGSSGATVNKEEKATKEAGVMPSTLGDQPIGPEPEPKNKVQSLIISGRAADVDKAITLAEMIDVKAPQIKIDAKITSISDTGEKKLGLSWEWDKIAFLETGTNAWKRGFFDFGATLEALVESGDAKLLASPSIVCLENKPGVFFVGDDVTYIIRVEVTPTGQNVQTETKSVGVQLRVVGDVSPDNLITLNLHPEVSTLKLQENKAANIFLPIVSRRFTDHVVRVKSGQTIVLGGLIRDDDIVEMSKVPVLGDIPFFGNLFRHRHTLKQHTEVVMFITASVLED